MDDTVICTGIEEVKGSLSDILLEIDKLGNEDAHDHVIAAINSLNSAINSIEAAAD